MSRFSCILTVDTDRLRVNMSTLYQSGNRYNHGFKSFDSEAVMNKYVVLFIQQQTASFGEDCIHLVKFAPVEDSDNGN